MLYDKRWDVLGETGRMLMDAADYMERHGWCRYQWKNADGAVCFRGALREVNASASAHEKLATFLGVSPTIIGDWHDAFCRSKDEAVGILRAAATCRE